jgi:hypothetical protein
MSLLFSLIKLKDISRTILQEYALYKMLSTQQFSSNMASLELAIIKLNLHNAFPMGKLFARLSS